MTVMCPLRLILFTVILGSTFGEERTRRIDLLRHSPDDRVNLKLLDSGTYEWELPEGLGQKLTIDLPAQDIDVSEYDELRFDIKPIGSQVGLNVIIYGLPSPDELSSWYLKFKAQTGQWSSGRFDLHLDDDGTYLSRAYARAKKKFIPGTLQIRLYRRILGFPGEPRWRKAQLRNIRLVKRLVSIDFKFIETEQVWDTSEIAYIYKLHITNRTNRRLKPKLELDSAHTLHYFEVDGPREIELRPQERKVIPVRLYISRKKAMSLPPLYSEPLFPKLYIPDVPDSDVVVLRGYRRFPMWGSVPIFNKRVWRPETLQAELSARQKLLPNIAKWRQSVIRSADYAMKHDWPAPPFGPPGHDQNYRCRKCKRWLEPFTPISFHKHICPQCKQVFENNEVLDRAWLMRYNGRRARDVRRLGLAYLLTGDQKYALKAMKILLTYATAYPHLPLTSTRSTSAGSKLGGTTLSSSYVIPYFAEGYAYIRDCPALDEDNRVKIVDFLKKAGISVVQHSVEYNNQQAEHFRAYGTVGLAINFLPLTAEAIYGDFGWHELTEYGYSEDGIAHEAGGYHWAVFLAMCKFGSFALSEGVNLFTARFKRVFDGSISAGLLRESPWLELAYRAYRDPHYLPLLLKGRERPNELTAFWGLLGLPEPEQMPVRSVLMKSAGYIYLRKGSASDWLGISLNYIKPFDRHERDKFTTFFYKNGRQVDATVGRITYGSPYAGWMYATPAHNTIVIDGQDQRKIEGKLLAFQPSPEAPAGVVATEPSAPLYEGVSQLRAIALIGESFVVLDRIISEKPRTIDRYQYGKGTAKLSFNAKPLPALKHLPEKGHFSQILGGKCGREILVEFGNGLKMRLISDADMEYYKGLTIGGYQAKPIEFTFARRANATSATFLASFTLGTDTTPPHLRIIKTADKLIIFDVGNYQIHIQIPEGRVKVLTKKTN